MNTLKKIILVLVLVVVCCFGVTYVEAAETGNTYYLLDDNKISDVLETNVRVVAKVKTGVTKEQLASQISYNSATDTVTVNGLNATAFSSYCSKFYIKSDSNIGTFSPKARITIDGEVAKKVLYQEIQNVSKVSCANKVYMDEPNKSIYVNSMGISGTNVIYAAGSGNATVLTVNSTNKNDTITWSANSNSVSFNETTTSSNNGQVLVTSTASATTKEKVSITATASDGSSANFDLEIVPATISLNMAEMNLYISGSGTTGTLQATVNGVPGNAGVVWQSSDPSCVQVVDGAVTALREGSVRVTATANGVSAECIVTVSKPALVLDKTSATIYHEIANKKVQLSASLNGVPLSSGVTWSSNKPGIATVDATGKVTGVSVGKATITAVANGVSQTCKIIVEKSYMKLENLEVEKGSKKAVTVIINGQQYNDTENKLSWVSGDESIATVNKNGKVTGQKKGTTTIMAVFEKKGLFAECSVKVTKK